MYSNKINLWIHMKKLNPVIVFPAFITNVIFFFIVPTVQRPGYIWLWIAYACASVTDWLCDREEGFHHQISARGDKDED
jgi:hypothetical protein